ncbi:MAG TPA: hypothetical protein EYQ69_01585 [Gemmatimonadetes bacterium]|jgi:hypothetical protein|nr:hypothetical protein [Gemmatimonadota bacterium]
MSESHYKLRAPIATQCSLAQNPKNSRGVCILIALLTFIIWSCTNQREEIVAPDMGRETFINAYITLSTADMANLQVRDSILETLSISSNALEHFVSYHGSDVNFMAEIWDEVQVGIDQILNDQIFVPQ